MKFQNPFRSPREPAGSEPAGALNSPTAVEALSRIAFALEVLAEFQTGRPVSAYLFGRTAGDKSDPAFVRYPDRRKLAFQEQARALVASFDPEKAEFLAGKTSLDPENPEFASSAQESAFLEALHELEQGRSDADMTGKVKI